MWDTERTDHLPISHDLPCLECGHAAHTFLPCSDTCQCPPNFMPGARPQAA